MVKFVFLTVISALFLLAGCNKDNPVSSDDDNSTPVDTNHYGGTANGYVIFQVPRHYTAWRTDSAYYTIQWYPQLRDTFSYVSLALFRHDTLLTTIDASDRNDGSYSWYPTGLSTSTAYRIRIRNTSDTALFDFSDSFRISSIYTGSLAVTAPLAGAAAKMDSALTVRWTRTGNIGYYVGIQLWADTVLAATATSSYYTTGTTDSYNWSYLSTTQGSGNRYRIRIYSVSDPGIFAWSGYFSVSSLYHGTYTVTEPTALSVWVAGAGAYNVTWNSTGSPGTNVKMELVQSGVSKVTLVSSTANDGVQSVSLTGDVVGGDYQLKISSVSDAGLFSLSPSFSVIGPDPTDTTTNGRTNNGNIRFIYPYSRAWLHLDTTYLLCWEPLRDSSSYVSIWLYRNDTAITTLSSSTLNDGSFSYYFSSLPTSRSYRLRIRSNADTSRFEFSDSFTVASGYTGVLSVTAPIAGTLAKIDSALTVRWTATGNIGSYVTIRLYRDTVYAGPVTTYASASQGYYSWSYLSTTQGSGNQYRFYVFSQSDSSIGAWSDYFTVTSLYNGTYTLTEPIGTSVWSAGSSYGVTWLWSGTPGNYVKLELLKDGMSLYVATTGTSNDGSYTLSTPGYLTTGKYQLRISSTSDPAISTVSDSFSIAGLPQDPGEPDNSRAAAQAIPADGTLYSRVLSLNDTDWISFAADSGTTYLIRNISADVATELLLYEGNKASYSQYWTSGSGNTQAFAWTCDTSAVHYLRVVPDYYGYYGAYQISVSEIDSTRLVSFAVPAQDTVMTAGTGVTLYFTTDSLLFGNYVYLYLYRDSVSVLSLAASYTYDYGYYTWTIPAGLASGDRYRIKVVDRYNSALYGFSPYFAIQGATPDSFEPDNIASQARTIPVDGSAQSRSITYADSDWVFFHGGKDSLYIITAAGTPTLYMYLYSASSAGYIGYDSYTNPQIVFSCTTSGVYRVKVSPYSTSSAGDYSLTVRGVDRNRAVDFNDPTALSTWTAGASYTVNWQPDTSLFGSAVRLYLTRRGMQVSTIITTLANNGTYSWNIPAGLASGNGYRIRMENYANAVIYGFSDSFTISGIAEDAFEPDDSIGAAGTVTTDGLVQKRTLTLNNGDYGRFTAQRNFLYRISASTLYPRIDLYSAATRALIVSANTSGADSTANLTWFCTSDGDYAAGITGSLTGDYRLSITEYDSGQYLIPVSQPQAGASLTRGAGTTVTWRDSLGVGGTVDLFLYNAAGVVLSIATATANDGSFAWTVPAAAEVRNDYYIRVISRIHSSIYGLSGVFGIQ